MTRPRAKSVSLTKVSKAVRLPRHSLSPRLQRVLDVVDGTHAPKNLKTISVVMNPRVMGGLFLVHADTGPYELHLNPYGSHPEFSLLHEVGHYLEWQSIPKVQHGPRDFGADPRFTPWLQAVYATPTVQRLLALLEQQQEETQAFRDIGYWLLPNELWTRAYSQYVTRKTSSPVLFQQIAAENKVIKGNIRHEPYWNWEEFPSVQMTMDAMFIELGWSK